MRLIVVIVAALIWSAIYMISCAFWPWANCSRCGGGGRKRSPSGNAFRDCRKCKGTGRQLRIGRRLWNAYRGGS